MTCTTSTSVSWTPSSSAYTSTYSEPWDTWVLSHPQPCPALLLPNHLRKSLPEVSPTLGAPPPPAPQRVSSHSFLVLFLNPPIPTPLRPLLTPLPPLGHFPLPSHRFLFNHWGHWMDWSLAFLLVISLLVTYASLLLLLALLLRLCGQPLRLHSVHKVLLLFIMLLVAAGLVGLDIQWQQEWRSLRLSLQATAPFLHIGAVAGITLLAWPVADTFYRIHRRACPLLPAGPKILLLFLFFGIALASYLAPLCISSPCIMEPRDLPPKPGLVGHRGAPMLAPENTLMSLRKTAECGAAVFETDVMVSSDGIPFLMHDEHLSRTTDVASVFPTRITTHSSDFSWAELKRLNAGAWFLERRPFWGAKQLSGTDRKEAENQTVPTLEELLKEAAVLNLSIMFDLRRPPPNHTYHDTFVNQTLETVLSARVPQDMVLWLPDEDRAKVQQRAPKMRQIYGQQGGNRTERPQYLNLPYQDLPLLDIKALHQDNVSVNLFVVNKPWLFSLLWCAGVDSVTTNDCQLLQQMHYPVWLIPPQTYLMMWIVTDCVSTLLLLWTFLLQGRCAKEKERTGLETAVLLTRINNFLME
nr:glycerophosphoinositol inositolphosphodiesterase GDPD2 isoform X3 [Equus asinus]